MTELMVIFVVALLVLGPKKLPGLARSLGRSLAEFRRASLDLRQSVMEATEEQPAQTAQGGRTPAERAKALAAGASPPAEAKPGDAEGAPAADAEKRIG